MYKLKQGLKDYTITIKDRQLLLFELLKYIIYFS